MKTDPSQTLDLAILGGGINGAALAFLAARAGLSVALFEKGDWAQGTSSRSTKLIHGGIRYLEQGRIGLVRESLRERRSLLSDAPHLVRPLPFLLPVYRGDRRPPWMLKAGLAMYDRLSAPRHLPAPGWFTEADLLRRYPALKVQGLLGGGLYWDAQVNDARLVWENVLGARENGALCRSYAEVVKLVSTGEGWALTVRDSLPDQSGGELTYHARALADTTGPWADRTARMRSPGAPPRVRPTRGSHLVVPQVGAEYALLVTPPGEKRILFVVPWRGQSLVGTTDLDDPGDPDRVRCTTEEADYLLGNASRVLPQAAWGRDRVMASFSGIRPLALAGSGSASSVSREDRITVEGRVVGVLGGKLTTYRSMARKALARVLGILGRGGNVPPDTRLPGAPLEGWGDFKARAQREWPSLYGISGDQATHLAGMYGGRAPAVLEAVRSRGDLARPLAPGFPDLAAQALYAVHREDARRLDDVLLRRLEGGYQEGRMGVVEPLSRIVGEALGWNETRRTEEVSRVRALMEPPPFPAENT